MACRSCGSDNLQKFNGELTANLPTLANVKVAPVYLCQPLTVCLDCGFAELRIATEKLELLKKQGGLPRSVPS